MTFILRQLRQRLGNPPSPLTLKSYSPCVISICFERWSGVLEMLTSLLGEAQHVPFFDW